MKLLHVISIVLVVCMHTHVFYQKVCMDTLFEKLILNKIPKKRVYTTYILASVKKYVHVLQRKEYILRILLLLSKSMYRYFNQNVCSHTLPKQYGYTLLRCIEPTKQLVQFSTHIYSPIVYTHILLQKIYSYLTYLFILHCFIITQPHVHTHTHKLTYSDPCKLVCCYMFKYIQEHIYQYGS